MIILFIKNQCKYFRTWKSFIKSQNPVYPKCFRYRCVKAKFWFLNACSCQSWIDCLHFPWRCWWHFLRRWKAGLLFNIISPPPTPWCWFSRAELKELLLSPVIFGNFAVNCWFLRFEVTLVTLKSSYRAIILRIPAGCAMIYVLVWYVVLLVMIGLIEVYFFLRNTQKTRTHTQGAAASDA